MLDLFNVLASGEYCVGLLGNASIPNVVGNMIHYIYLGIQIVAPILLILFGMIDLAKALTSSKEDEIKKAQSGLLKKAVVAIIIFLVFFLVRFVFNFAGGNGGAWRCVDQLITGKPGSASEND